jgi:hypothetical protein
MAARYGSQVEPGWIGGAAMPGAPDIGAKFLAGLQVGISGMGKEQQYKNQLASYALKVQNMEYQQQRDADKYALAQERMKWDQDKWQLNNQWQRVKEQNDVDAATRANDFREQGLILRSQREERLSDKITKTNEAEGGAAGVLSYLQTQGIGFGHPDFYAKYTELMTPWLAHSATVKTTFSNMLQKSNQVRDDNQRALDAAEKRFNENIGQTLGGGNVLEQNKQWYLHPEDYEDVWEGGIGFGSHGFGRVKTDKKKIILSTGAEKIVHMNDIQKLQREAADLETRRKGIAAPINQPDIGVMSAEPAPARKEDMQPNHVYTFPTGTFRWTGTDLVAVQVGDPTEYRMGAQ